MLARLRRRLGRLNREPKWASMWSIDLTDLDE